MCSAAIQAQLREAQQQLSAAAEGHRRETAQLQAQLRQITEERNRDAQDLESAQEELQRQKEHHDSERQRLIKRQEGLLKVHIRMALICLLRPPRSWKGLLPAPACAL